MYEQLINRCREIVKCDTARISKPQDTMYFIIGKRKNTKDDAGEWYKNGKPFNFDYVEEQVVASGKTEDELIKSVIEYRRLLDMTMEEYFKELLKKGGKSELHNQANE